MAAMSSESIRVTRSVTLPVSEIDLRFSRSSGPGGQHAQRSETRVEALFDVEASSALSQTQKRRVTSRAGPVIRDVHLEPVGEENLAHEVDVVAVVVDDQDDGLHAILPRMCIASCLCIAVDQALTANGRDLDR